MSVKVKLRLSGFVKLLMLSCVFCLSACQTTKSKTQMVANATERAKVHTELSSKYYEFGQVGTAVSEAMIALSASPNYLPTHLLLGVIYSSINDIKRSDAYFKNALTLAERQKISATDIRNSYAWHLCQTQRYQLAMKQFSYVLSDRIYSSMDKALTNVGVCSARMGRLDLAQTYLRAAMASKPSNLAAQLYLGHILVSQKKLDEAERLLLQVQSNAQGNSDIKSGAYWLGARVYAYKGDRKRVDAYLKLLSEQAPSSKEADWAKQNQYNRF